MITRESEHIRVEGHYGTWHVIDGLDPIRVEEGS